MERARRLYELWSWLVPFRAVAETGGLPAASERLRVAPSALSRSVRLLEDRLGAPLFERRSQRLVLNPAGQALLAAVRAAMRTIDDAVAEVAGGIRTVRIGCAGEVLPLVCAALRGGAAPDGVELAVDTLAEPGDPEGCAADLCQGTIDLVIATEAPRRAGLVARRIGALPRAVFAAPGARSATGELVYAVPLGRDGAACDGVPAATPRTIGLRTRQRAAVIEAARSGGFAAVLPRAVGVAAGLGEVAAGPVPPVEVWIATRSARDGDAVTPVADALGAALTGWCDAGA